MIREKKKKRKIRDKLKTNYISYNCIMNSYNEERNKYLKYNNEFEQLSRSYVKINYYDH